MNRYLAIAIYRGVVADAPTGSLDIQTCCVEGRTEEDVVRRLRDSRSQGYENSDGERVTWELCEIMAIEELGQIEPGDELIGFVAGVDELRELAMPGDGDRDR